MYMSTCLHACVYNTLVPTACGGNMSVGSLATRFVPGYEFVSHVGAENWT